ncbi:MAG: hypothetical protein KatS3mg111_1921 [Pirellulaceae bacterium]|nr:MAG: hypothetical protein KatS3mg111_1921 [Pirellulaceae bacterium]
MAKKKRVEQDETTGLEPQEAVEELPFEAALQRLEEIVGQLESGDVPLDEALREYALAVKLIRRCHQVLDQAEHQIEMLSRIDAEGNPVVESVEDETLGLESSETATSSRRSRR